jgi:hypothetical protein
LGRDGFLNVMHDLQELEPGTCILFDWDFAIVDTSGPEYEFPYEALGLEPEFRMLLKKNMTWQLSLK